MVTKALLQSKLDMVNAIIDGTGTNNTLRLYRAYGKTSLQYSIGSGMIGPYGTKREVYEFLCVYETAFADGYNHGIAQAANRD